MNDILFYTLVIAFIYFIYTRIIENYGNIENFDPSLVPVSSIITLAKVGQKIINGNTTMDNLGGLQVGYNNTATGNLNVSGDLNFPGLATNLKFTKGTLPDNTKIQWGDGSGWRVRFQKDDQNPQLDIYDNRNIKVFGSENINNNLIIDGANLNLNKSLIIGNKAKIYSVSDPFALPNDKMIRLMNVDGTSTYSGENRGGFAAFNLYSNNDTTVDGNLTVRGTAKLKNLNVTSGGSFNNETKLRTSPNTWAGDNPSIKSIDTKNRFYFKDNERTEYNSGDGTFEFKTGPSDTIGMKMTNNLLEIMGNLNITNNSVSCQTMVNTGPREIKLRGPGQGTHKSLLTNLTWYT